MRPELHFFSPFKKQFQEAYFLVLAVAAIVENIQWLQQHLRNPHHRFINRRKYFAGTKIQPQIETKKNARLSCMFFSPCGRKREKWRFSRQQSLLEFGKQYSWRAGVKVEALHSKCQSQFIADQQGAALITVQPLWDGRRVFLLETDAGASPQKGRTKGKKQW